ncbi:acyl-CoA dehydrogenase family protein [Syntrophomonas curvata]
MWFMTEERELMRNVARDFVQNEVKPVAVELDKKREYPLQLFRRAGELGLVGCVLPEEYGGLGGDWITKMLITEEIAKELPTLAIVIGTHIALAGGIVNMLGTPQQKAKYLTPAAKGEHILAFASTEPAGCFAHPDFETRAELVGNEWVINGAKIFITNIGYANTYVVVAKTSEPIDPITRKGLSMFLVEKDSPGFEVGKVEEKYGWHGSSTGSLYFRNCRIPKENLLGPLGESLSAMVISATDEFMACGALGLGIAETCYEKAKKYTRERIQLGNSMYNSHQVIRHMLAKMSVEIESLRALTMTAAAQRDSGQFPLVLGRMCKIKGYETAMFCANECVQLHGGLGVIEDTGVERHLRDARLIGIAGGAIEAMMDQIDKMQMG